MCRPNVVMYDDPVWNSVRSDLQEAEFNRLYQTKFT